MNREFMISKALTRPNGSFTEYQYNDPLKKLTAIINKNSSNQKISSYNYTYFTSGETTDLIWRETVSTGEAINTFVAGTTTYTPNTLNQLVSTSNPNRTYLYDDDGNMTTGFTPEGYTLTMTYDAENRMKTAEYTDNQSVIHLTEYSYSGDSLLAKQKKYDNGILISETNFVRAGFLPIQERDSSNTVAREYTWGLNLGGGIGGLLNLRQNSNDYSYLYDGKGNVSSLINGSQSVVASYRYDLSGVLMKKTATIEQPYMFSTKQYDEKLGFLRYEYRILMPEPGKWTTRDPLGEYGGINLYRTIGNNLVNWFDPLGLQSLDHDKGQFGPVTNALWDFWKNYKKMKDANTIGADKYFHCMAHCQAAKEGPVGKGLSNVVGEGRELLDEYINNPRKGIPKEVNVKDCNEDREANRLGREGDPKKSCSEICAPLRPQGLDPKY